MPDSQPQHVAEGDTLVRIRDLVRYFDVSPPFLNRLIERMDRRIVKAVDGVSFEISKGETFSLVGESGCGKSTIARLVVGLYAPSGGEIFYAGVPLGQFVDREKIPVIQSKIKLYFKVQ